MICTTGAGPTVTIRPHPLGQEWGTVLGSNDPWYGLFRGVAEVFLAGEIDATELACQVSHWSITGDRQQREIACPAARQLLEHMILAVDEPSCICIANWDGPPCIRNCEPMDRHARLRQLMGISA